MKYAFIIPVYNRPNEVKELLQSLTTQVYQNFEVILVEDGSTHSCEEVVVPFLSLLHIKYLQKENTGPGLSRNYGAKYAEADFLIFLDSDVVLPAYYLLEVDCFLKKQQVDAFGGPDKAHASFTHLQKAINYSMTSFFTTGGIRGGKKQLERYHPRSFNLGVKQKAFQAIGGFSAMRFGEDIDFSMRLMQSGYSTKLILKAWVWHKRRVDFKKFFKQVHNSGRARINLSLLHRGSLKFVHTLPACFTIGVFLLVVFSFFSLWFLTPLAIFCVAILVDAFLTTKSLKIACLALIASFVQLIGYGTGFILAFWQRIVLKRKNSEAFKNNFYQ